MIAGMAKIGRSSFDSMGSTKQRSLTNSLNHPAPTGAIDFRVSDTPVPPCARIKLGPNESEIRFVNDEPASPDGRENGYCSVQGRASQLARERNGVLPVWVRAPK